MLTPGTYPATSSSARTSAPSASFSCSSRVAAFSAGDSSVVPATEAARVRSSPLSSTWNNGSLIDTPPVGNRCLRRSSVGPLLLGREDLTVEVLLARDRPFRLGEDPVLLLDGERRVVVGAQVGVDDGLVLADRL